MTEQLTVSEWEAVLAGRAIPADKLAGETIARYVHRKVAELVKERDRLKEDNQGLREDFGGLL